ncbi:MAG: response regulator [Planctomycetota bacterium]|jgi:CheY-like chemotaxis protein
MTSSRPKLVLLKRSTAPAAVGLDERTLATLRSALDVVEVENVDEARAALADAGPGGVLLDGALTAALPAGAPPEALSWIGEGVGIVDEHGRLVWSDGRLQALDEPIRQRFIERCERAIRLFNRTAAATRSPEQRPSRTLTFGEGDLHYELLASVASVAGELMRMDSGTIRQMNMAERLRLLEEKVVRSVHELLKFDNFEIRLLDKETSRLELVLAKGLSPLKIGEVIYALPEGNGISGYVASTGRSYICPDTRSDPLYREGLDNAASSLTVPLRLHDEVIGVLNVESDTPKAFTEKDRQFTEIFGRYVAMAMHILDLLVVERFTTNEQVSANVLSELNAPIEEIEQRANTLAENGLQDPAIRQEVESIRAAVAQIRRRIQDCTRGPKTILAAEQELQRLEPEPVLRGRRILIADNDEEIRTTLERLLTQKGCDVTVCANGIDTIAAIESTREGTPPFELIISDIKMADRTGYEIFQATKTVCADTPVVLMTGFGYDPHHSIIRASQEGLHALLFKPFKASQLVEVIKKAFTAPVG